MQTVPVYRKRFNGELDFACDGEVVLANEKVVKVKMPIGDVYTFSTRTRRVKDNTQQLEIGEINEQA